MRLGRTIKRASIIAIAGAATLALSGAPASAHVIIIDPPGSEEEPKVGWVGGGPLPDEAAGEGLVPGGLTGDYLQPPSHTKGLNSACEALRANGRSAVDIFGPPTPAGCPHGT